MVRNMDVYVPTLNASTGLDEGKGVFADKFKIFKSRNIRLIQKILHGMAVLITVDLHWLEH